MRYLIPILFLLSGCSNSTDYASTAVSEHPEIQAYCYSLKQQLDCIEPYKTTEDAEKACKHHQTDFKETNSNAFNILTPIDKIKFKEIEREKDQCVGIPPEPETKINLNDPIPETQKERKEYGEQLKKDTKALEDYRKQKEQIIKQNQELFIYCNKQGWKKIIDYLCS